MEFMDQLFAHSPQALMFVRIGFAAFFAILFIQSGSDKVINFRENMSYIVAHFSKTTLSGLAPVLFILLTLFYSLFQKCWPDWFRAMELWNSLFTKANKSPS